jgi:hypothetical protein
VTELTPNGLNQLVRDYVDDAIANSPKGAHRWDILRHLRSDHPEVGDYRAPLDTHLLSLIDKAIKPKRSETAPFPGMGSPIGITVTIPDGERGFVVKALQYATEADLIADEMLHQTNVTGAVHARDLARHRNKRLIPIMHEHGLSTAGEALSKLVELGEDDD